MCRSWAGLPQAGIRLVPNLAPAAVCSCECQGVRLAHYLQPILLALMQHPYRGVWTSSCCGASEPDRSIPDRRSTSLFRYPDFSVTVGQLAALDASCPIPMNGYAPTTAFRVICLSAGRTRLIWIKACTILSTLALAGKRSLVYRFALALRRCQRWGRRALLLTSSRRSSWL